MKVNYLIISNNAFIDQDGKLNVLGIFDRIAAISFPVIMPTLFVATNITLSQGSHKEYARIKKGDWLVDTAESLVTKDIEGKHRFVHNFSNIVFPEAGEYLVEIHLDGVVVADDKLYIEKI
jgi:hypothetical protein